MRVLIVTKIFPNHVEPHSAPFNRRQFAALSRLCQVEVLATIPWFPGASAFQRWSAAGRLSCVPEQEEIEGMRVRHPRFAFLPKIGRGLAGPLYAASLAATVLPYRGRVDVVLGAWAYPDGFAAVVIAELLGVPAVIKLHGSDINVLGSWAGPRRRLAWALPRAERIVAVSRPLAERAVQLGADPARVDIVPNGIERELFRPGSRSEARALLGLPGEGKLVLFVGHITREKGAMDLLRAFHERRARLDAQLVFLGDGAGAEECRRLALALGVPALFVGAQPHDRVPDWLAACDLLALPSWNEGMPNVAVEALACGRPVVATRVGGLPELIGPKNGLLVPVRAPPALADAIAQALATEYDPDTLSRELERPSWEGSAQLLASSLLGALGRRASEAA